MRIRKKLIEMNLIRLALDLPISIHEKVKRIAAFRYESMRQYAMRAILEQLKKDEDHIK